MNEGVYSSVEANVGPPQEPHYVQSSLFCFKINSKSRAIAIRWCTSRVFNVFSTLAIVAYCTVQCFYQPTEPDGEGFNAVLDDVNLAFQIYFSLEILIKAIAFGFVLKDGERVGQSFKYMHEKCTVGFKHFIFGVPGAIHDAHLHGPDHTSQEEEEKQQQQEQEQQKAVHVNVGNGTPYINGVDVHGEMEKPSPGDVLPPKKRTKPRFMRLETIDSVGSLSLRRDATEFYTCDEDDEHDAAIVAEEAHDLVSPFAAMGALPATASFSDRFKRIGVTVIDMKQHIHTSNEVPPLTREGWGAMDAIIVGLSWLSFIPGVGNSLTTFRALRLLLPLKMLSTLPGLKVGIQSILASLPMLANIALAMAFVLVVWTILGMQLFQDALHYNCFVLSEAGAPLPFGQGPGTTPEGNEGRVCSKIDSLWEGFQCPADLNQTCLSGGSTAQEYLDQLSFDNMWDGLVLNFLVMTSWWGKPTAQIMSSTVGWAYFYSLLLLIIGSFFLVNLVLAVLADNYMEQHKANLALTEEERLKDKKIVQAWRYCSEKCGAVYNKPLPGCLGNPEEWRWRKPFIAIDKSLYFDIAVLLIVLANAVVLAMRYYGMSETYSDRLTLVNNILAFCFLAEATIKIIAQGRAYFTSAFNLFDFVITIASVVGVFISGASGLSALRALRALRMLRLLTVIESLQRFLVVMVNTLVLSASFLVLVLFTMLLFALLGMQLFGGEWEWSVENPDVPRYSFNTFGDAMLTTFIILLGSMDVTMFTAMDTTTPAAALYYIATIMVGNFMVLNLLIALLFTLFNEENSARLKNKQRSKSQMSSLFRKLSGIVEENELNNNPSMAKMVRSSGLESNRQGNRVDSNRSDRSNASDRGARRRFSLSLESQDASMSAHQAMKPWYQRASSLTRDLVIKHDRWVGAQDAAFIDLEGTSFWVFELSHPVRKFCYHVIDDKRFSTFVFLVIVFNCAALAVDTPGNSEELDRILGAIDLACLVVYCIEAVFKLIALSAFTGPWAYFKSPWTVLDFVVVVTSLASTVFAELGWAQALRLLRVLRPLRLMSRIKEIQAVVTCLYKSLLSVLNVVIVAFVVLLVFAILGMELYMGEFYSCTSTTCCVDEVGTDCQTVITEEQCTGFAPLTMSASGMLESAPEECRWVNANFNFDNIWESTTTLLILMQGSDVEDAMLLGMDSVGQGMQPQPNASTWTVIYFICYVFFGTLFIASLLVGVIIDNYVEEVKLQGPGILLTDKQREWVDAQRHLLKDRPPKKVRPPAVKWRRKLFEITHHRLFDLFIGLCVGLNIVVMCMQHYQQSDEWTDSIQLANTIFTIIFCVESILKILALYPAAYFSDNWNVFDFIVSWASVPGIFITTGPGVNVLRALRVARLLRLVRHVRSLRRMVASFYIATPIIGNALLLFLLIIFVFAVLGVQLFYGTMPLQPLAFNTEFYNWQSVPNAMVMLSIAATGDDPNQFMFDTEVQEPNCITPHCEGLDGAALLDTYTNQTSCTDAGYVWIDKDTCGSELASLYFVPFILLVSLIIINIVIAIVIEAFRMTRDMGGVDADDMEQYRDLWMQYDPDGTGFIDMSQFASLLRSLNQPLGLKGRGSINHTDALSFITQLPGLTVDVDGSVYYHEALQALTASAMEVSLDDLDDDVKATLMQELEYRKVRQRVLYNRLSGQLSTSTPVLSHISSNASTTGSGEGGRSKRASAMSIEAVTAAVAAVEETVLNGVPKSSS